MVAYIREKVPNLKSGENVVKELAQMFWAYKGRSITALAEACKFYAARRRRPTAIPWHRPPCAIGFAT